MSVHLLYRSHDWWKTLKPNESPLDDKRPWPISGPSYPFDIVPPDRHSEKSLHSSIKINTPYHKKYSLYQLEGTHQPATQLTPFPPSPKYPLHGHPHIHGHRLPSPTHTALRDGPHTAPIQLEGPLSRFLDSRLSDRPRPEQRLKPFPLPEYAHDPSAGLSTSRR